MMKVIEDNPWVRDYTNKIEERYANFLRAKKEICDVAGSVQKFADSYKEYGVHHVGNGILYKEYAPNAARMFLVGEFNDWERDGRVFEATKDPFGTFSLFIPDGEDGPVIKHNTRIKVKMILHSGETIYRIPAWINYALPSASTVYDGVFWNPPEKYQFKHELKPSNEALLIYETHIGMAGIEPRIHTYREFEDQLPRIKGLGYNTIQVMAIMEHAYYASFGYQVTNFFATSSRYGTPEELKSLVDKAHSMGIRVLLDLIHSHASKNVEDGLNQFDGTDHHYFHAGGKGNHSLWDSRLFDYGKFETKRFLLSNLKYYLAEFRFDGFRFDGVTSMIYLHHGHHVSFVNIGEYFSGAVDEDAVTYLTLANDLIHEFNPNAVTIAEDVSGMFGLARSVADGGIGFDYRLGMAAPDMWIKYLKELRDDDWNMGHIAFTLNDRPYKEKTVAYCESHDQALVGDKTLAFWLMDKEMYDFMSVLSPKNAIIDRGIALHKMIRLVTFSLGGEAYLTFMGNEFGHPEWIDFPRIGNNDSFDHCRRRFDLPRDHLLKYKSLEAFDKDMIHLEKQYHVLSSGDNGYISLKHEGDKILAFERNGLLFIFNFHPTKSFPDYSIGVEVEGNYKIILNSDEEVYEGFKRVDSSYIYKTQPGPYCNRKNYIRIYIPNRCAFVLAKC